MKKIVFILMTALLWNGMAAVAQETPAQPQPNRAELIEKIFIAELTQKLSLTPDEAQKFWPVFNKFKLEWRTANSTHKDDILKRQEAELEVKKRYKPEFQKVLNSEERSNKVFKVFDNFVNRLRAMQERKQQRKENGPAVQPRPGGRRNI
jgi:hypothetical protein